MQNTAVAINQNCNLGLVICIVTFTLSRILHTSSQCLSIIGLLAFIRYIHSIFIDRKAAAVHSIQGARGHMEDAYYGDHRTGFFAVYDGHVSRQFAKMPRDVYYIYS